MGASGGPVMAVWGDVDRGVPYAAAEDLARDVPGLKLETISGGNHSITYTHPDAIGPLLTDFVSSQRN